MSIVRRGWLACSIVVCLLAAGTVLAGPEERGEEQKTDVQAKTMVHVIRPSGVYMDLAQPLAVNLTSLMGGSIKQKSFYRLCAHVDGLAANDELEHVVFDLSDSELTMNPAQLGELTRRIKGLGQAGKKTYAWLEDASAVQLSLAAACDEVWMADLGGADLPSIAMQTMYLRDAMDLFGVQASVVRAGDFKGAVEPYTLSQMSPHLREHYRQMIESINEARVARIADGRELSADDVRALQAQRFFTAEEAVAAGLVDRLAPYGRMRETVQSHIGKTVQWTEPKKKPKGEMTFFQFMGKMMSQQAATSGLPKPSLVVLHLSGTIVDGSREQPGSIVAGPTVEAIEQLARDTNVLGVVARINSPGGVATASEGVRQALVKLAEKKPVAVSMGEMAASGGYWISCIDAPVYAEPGTITGSIGVFGMKLSFGPLLRRLGVRMESITLDEAASAFAVDRVWTEQQQDLLGKHVGQMYDRFVELVADKRKMQRGDVEEIAGGRVWSGAQAKELGLVDEIGGVDCCLAHLRSRLDRDDLPVVHRPKVKSGLDLLDLFGEEEEEIRAALPLGVLKALMSRGYRLDTTQVLLRDSWQSPGGPPRVWLLHPTEIQLR